MMELTSERATEILAYRGYPMWWVPCFRIDDHFMALFFDGSKMAPFIITPRDSLHDCVCLNSAYLGSVGSKLGLGS